jgi:hypothetical protein
LSARPSKASSGRSQDGDVRGAALHSHRAANIEQLDGLVRVAWIQGPHEISASTVVSLTDFHYKAAQDLAGSTDVAVELRRSWPVMEGAVGLWLWACPEELRGGSVSVWRAPEDLRRFVRWPFHQEIMDAWRDRGTVRHTMWQTHRPDLETLWANAVARLTAS